MKLLVIDDEMLVRKGIVSLIPYKDFGISTVFEADNGKSGLDIVKIEEPDLILCDINMPKINGLDFAKEVKANWPWIRIAMITGYDYFDYARQAVKIGVDDYVLKPISKNDVIEVVQSLLRKSSESEKIREVYKTIQNSIEDEVQSSGYKKSIEEILEKNLANEDFTLSSLAFEIGLNDSYLSTLFKKLFGIPFRDYLVQMRMEKSKILLLSTDLKNYEIAEKIGISDPNYFSTQFKKYFGETPNQYKKKILRNS